jgi:hypothetical protein
MKADVNEFKITIKEINQKGIEYGILQNEQKGKELQEKEKIVKKEKKEKKERKGNPRYVKDTTPKDTLRK